MVDFFCDTNYYKSELDSQNELYSQGGILMGNKYPNLIAKGTIGKLETRNRTVMCAMGINQSDHGFVNQAVINHYAQRAKGGIGLIMIEVTCVDSPVGLNTANMLVIDDDKYIPGMTKLVSAIHDNGAKCLLQISHTGRGSRRKITGHQPVGPSAVAMPYSFMMGLGNEEPRELTIEEIKEIENKYANAALRAKKAGFDGIELHSVGYYMGQQFLSSTANVRTDEYGGNPENRVRFHLNIIKKMKELCGDDFTVAVKLSAVEMGEDAGITMEDGMYYAKRFQDAGVDAIEVLAGTWKKEASMADVPDSGAGKGQAIGLCAALKMGIEKMTGEPAKIKFIGGGRAQDPAVAENALATGQCDYIFIGKGVLAQPDLVNLIVEGREDEIRPCIGCGVCIDSQLQEGARGRCSGNAVMGHEDNDYTIEKAKTPKQIVVAGGGVAGVEAARIAALRGHHVRLFEKSDKIGGQIFHAMAPPHKGNMKPLITYLENQLKIHGVEVHLNTELTPEQILDMKPDAVICATGVIPATLPIPGFEIAVQSKDILTGAECGDQAVIIGGGSVGCETAEYLAEKGKKVTVIELLDTPAEKMVNVARTILLSHLKGYGVQILTSCKCKEITETMVIYEDKEGKNHTLPADTVIAANGDKPSDTLYQQLKGKIEPLYNIGDSAAPDSIATAVSQGYYTALKL